MIFSHDKKQERDKVRIFEKMSARIYNFLFLYISFYIVERNRKLRLLDVNTIKTWVKTSSSVVSNAILSRSTFSSTVVSENIVTRKDKKKSRRLSKRKKEKDFPKGGWLRARAGYFFSDWPMTHWPWTDTSPSSWTSSDSERWMEPSPLSRCHRTVFHFYVVSVTW